MSGPVHLHAARHVSNAILTQLILEVVEFVLHAIRKGLRHVDFEQKMHAARQVESVRHGFRAERLQPRRRGRGQVQCDDKLVSRRGIFVQHGLYDFAAAQLIRRVVDPQQRVASVRLGTFYRDATALQRFGCARDDGRRHLRVAGVGANLDRIVGRKQIRYCVHDADRDDECNEQITPQRVRIGRSRPCFRKAEQAVGEAAHRARSRALSPDHFSSNDFNVPFGSVAPTALF